MNAFSGLQLNEPGALHKDEKQITDATNLAVKFMDAADTGSVSRDRLRGFKNGPQTHGQQFLDRLVYRREYN